MPRLLAVSYGGGHVTMAIPVVRELQRRGGWDLTYLGLTTAGPALNAIGVPHLGFRDLVVDTDVRALEVGSVLARNEHMPGKGIPLAESVAYLGLSYVDLEQRVGVDEAARRFAARGRRAFLPLGPLERLVNRLRPDVIVATSAPRAEEAAIRVAGKQGIPAICVNDLFALDPQNDYLYEQGYADAVTVISEYARDVLVVRGRRADEIRVTGNPAFDALAEPGLAARAALWRREHAIEGRRVVLWASQPEPADPTLPERVRVAVVAAATRHDWYVVHRPHPSEPAPAPLSGGSGHAGRDEELGVLLTAVDVVVVLTTTVGLEAALVGKPVVKVRLSAYDVTMPYEEMGFATSAFGLDELESAIASALEDEPTRGRLAAARERLPRVGQAAGRVVDVIEAFA